jgi:hypothetical protein
MSPDRHPLGRTCRKALPALLMTAVVLALVTACGPESCGTRDISRYKVKDGHTVVEHCENGVWVRER